MRTRRSTAVLAALVLAVVAPLSVKADAWDSCRALIGNWVSISEGNNKGTGRFSLKLDLNGQVLVRKNHAELPAGQGRPAAVHDDLMII
ncbi:MAG TPA: hypothetical protein VFA18_09250, partial [Gemmataceae bacterium]|nr:hypothetical protein [Gemmataceae bacterium]